MILTVAAAAVLLLLAVVLVVVVLVLGCTSANSCVQLSHSLHHPLSSCTQPRVLFVLRWASPARYHCCYHDATLPAYPAPAAPFPLSPACSSCAAATYYELLLILLCLYTSRVPGPPAERADRGVVGEGPGGHLGAPAGGAQRC